MMVVCNRVLAALTSLQLIVVSTTNAVVVDGDKKKDMSPAKHQSDEKLMIDAFNTKTCGIYDTNYNDHEFVNMAREGQFPWLVSFQIKISSDKNSSSSSSAEDLHFCCGSFISDKWILSAAHCFAPDSIKNYLGNDKLKAVAGSHKVSSQSPISRNFTIERIYYHSRFEMSEPIGFDIALVELKERVNFSQKRTISKLKVQSEPFMNAICLPLKDKKYSFNETARIAGWGLSSDKDPSSMPTKLLTTDILINDKDECVRNYTIAMKSDRPKHQKEKYDDFLCAGYSNTRDACQSDSGAPLMQYSGGKAVAIGIVSYGIGCAKGIAGLYTRTSAFINWIKDITKNGKEASVAFKLLEAKNHRDRSSNVESTTTTERPQKASTLSPGPDDSTTTLPDSADNTTSSEEFRFFDQ